MSIKHITRSKITLINASLLILFCFTFTFTTYAETHNKKQFTIRLLDKVHQTPIADANVCLEQNNGFSTYAISDANGYLKLDFNPTVQGLVVISKVGFITENLPVEAISNGLEIGLTIDIFNIDQVVVTGEAKPTPIDSSIYKVKLITADKINKMGAINLSELLVSEANIRMSTDLILGSQIEMLGMSGQNVKIMIDGVPVIGRLDGNVDLNQINLANIAQVEIIEGPMSVVYGNNALAGTINLITKKQHYTSTSIQANTYYESVNRYAVNASASQRIKKHSINIDGGYEDFAGVDFDESTRSMEWKPKTLYRFNGGYGYNNKGWDINGKLGLYNDKLTYKSDILDGNYKVVDKLYYTTRFDVSANLSKKWGLNNINIVTAYNKYQRSDEEYSMLLTDLKKNWLDEEVSQDVNQKMLRGIYSRQIGLIDLQTGIDINCEQMQGDRIQDEEQTLGDYAAFVNIKWQLAEGFDIQPGVRYAYNTKYNAPLVYSLNTKWNISRAWSWRASVAKGFRAPDIKELYYVFVDSNHEIYGNPNLEAESSYNYNTSVEYTKRQPVNNWSLSFAAYYNDVNNMISLIQEDNSTAYYYQNINEYQSTGTNIDVKYGYKTLFTIRAGYGLTGRYNSYTKLNNSEQFNITHDLFAGLKITEPTSQLTLNADYKYSGKLLYFYTDTNDGTVKEGHQDGYHTMNASLSYGFLKNRFQIVGGVKNLFDVSNINRVSGSGGAHTSGSGGVPIAYGRSYFINLIYKFNKTTY